jgi:hypothetical protein
MGCLPDKLHTAANPGGQIGQDASGKVWLGYNEPQWLAQRHGIEGAEGVTGKVDAALRGLAAGATKGS